MVLLYGAVDFDPADCDVWPQCLCTVVLLFKLFTMIVYLFHCVGAYTTVADWKFILDCPACSPFSFR